MGLENIAVSDLSPDLKREKEQVTRRELFRKK
jgi:hypothetical protein